MAIIKGKWKWANDLTAIDAIGDQTYNVNFTSNHKQFTSLYLAWGTGGVYIMYDSISVTIYTTNPTTGAILKIYPNPLYQIIDFGNTEQEVDDNLYDLISTYATPITTKVTFNSDVAVEGDLIVKGAAITENKIDALIKDATIVVNSDGTELAVSNVGTVYRTGPEEAYGIVYNTQDQSIQLGRGTYNETDGFEFGTEEAQSLVTRGFDETAPNHIIPYWNSEKMQLEGDATCWKASSANNQSGLLESPKVSDDKGNYTCKICASRLIFDGYRPEGMPAIRIGEGEIRIGEAKLTEEILQSLLMLLNNPILTNNNNNN